jgi:GNAT superfamily N-acetyltransferase
VPVLVQRAAVADWPEIRRTRLSALTESPAAFASTLDREADLNADSWQQRVASGTWFVAREAGEPVGLVAGVADRETGGPHLVAMWVDPRVRGRGVGMALVEAVKDWAEAAAAEQLILWVADGNDRARRLYERCGFLDTGRRQPLPSDPSVGESLLACPLPGTAGPPVGVDPTSSV